MQYVHHPQGQKTARKQKNVRQDHALPPSLCLRTCAGVSRSAGLIGSAKAAGGDDGAVGSEAVDAAILHAPRHRVCAMGPVKIPHKHPEIGHQL